MIIIKTKQKTTLYCQHINIYTRLYSKYGKILIDIILSTEASEPLFPKASKTILGNRKAQYGGDGDALEKRNIAKKTKIKI